MDLKFERRAGIPSICLLIGPEIIRNVSVFEAKFGSHYCKHLRCYIGRPLCKNYFVVQISSVAGVLFYKRYCVDKSILTGGDDKALDEAVERIVEDVFRQCKDLAENEAHHYEVESIIVGDMIKRKVLRKAEIKSALRNIKKGGAK